MFRHFSLPCASIPERSYLTQGSSVWGYAFLLSWFIKDSRARRSLPACFFINSIAESSMSELQIPPGIFFNISVKTRHRAIKNTDHLPFLTRNRLLVLAFCEQFSVTRQAVLWHVDRLIPLAKDLSHPSTLIPEINYASNPAGVKSISWIRMLKNLFWRQEMCL